MKTFLINYVLIVQEYMQNGKKKEHKTILVEAEDKPKAKETLEKYWKDRCDSNQGITYTVTHVEIAPTIRQTEILK